jgi:integrase
MPVLIMPYPTVSRPKGGEEGGEEKMPPGGEGNLMSTRARKTLTAKFCSTVCQQGDYLDFNGPVKGLIFVVGSTARSKSWLLRYRFKGKRREMGLGSYPKTGLADAREKAAEARRALAEGFDPIEARKQKQWQGVDNATFKQMADDWIEHRGRKGRPEDRHRDSTYRQHKLVLNRCLKPLFDWPCARVTANDAYELVFKEIIERVPGSYEHVRWMTEAIFEWARARNQFPKNELNPVAKKGPFGVLVGGFVHHKKHLPGLHYAKIPQLVTAVRRVQSRDYYTCQEAAKASGYDPDSIYRAIYERQLKAEKSLLPFPTSRRHWQIKRTDLLAWVTAPERSSRKPGQLTELLPPPQTINSYVLEFAVITATRPSETRCMQWSEYHPEERIWVIPWQRHKEGRKTRRDHVIPLPPEAIKILEFLKQRQERDDIKTKFVFGHFINVNTLAKPGNPASAQGVRNLLKNLLIQEFGKVESGNTLHGTARKGFGSWADANHYDPKVKERCLNHIAGYGENEVERIYNRDTPWIQDMIPVFEAWARFCCGDGKPADVLPFRQKEKKRAVGG